MKRCGAMLLFSLLVLAGISLLAANQQQRTMASEVRAAAVEHCKDIKTSEFSENIPAILRCRIAFQEGAAFVMQRKIGNK
jgi:hypothetical protein